MRRRRIKSMPRAEAQEAMKVVDADVKGDMVVLAVVAKEGTLAKF